MKNRAILLKIALLTLIVLGLWWVFSLPAPEIEMYEHHPDRSGRIR